MVDENPELYEDFGGPEVAGYIKLCKAVVLDIARTLILEDYPPNREEYILTRQKTLRGGNDLWFEYSKMLDCKDLIVDVFKNCKTLAESREYMEKKYGYKFTKDNVKEKIVEGIINKEKQKEIAKKLNLSEATVSRFLNYFYKLGEENG